ncbi:MAG TPA: class I SAM-dependent methyltransferase [Vicinamibacterales bacterium]|nr:class I SAM-dependent methyltransferase [Vicinamibacterales bacterium]
MTTTGPHAEFREHADENRRIWDANARWWDDRIGGGNDFQTLLIEPATERLLEVTPGDTILDVACGAGRFTRRLAELGARVVAFDYSADFIARARERTAKDAPIEYRVIDAANQEDLLSLGMNRFSKAVCTMAVMDMPEIGPLFAGLSTILKPGGAFVFSMAHPCFHSATMQRFAEISEEKAGQHVIRSGVKVSSYLTPSARKTEGIIGQPEPQWFFHRSVSTIFRFGFEAGFVVDGIEEPQFPDQGAKAGVRWRDMPDIPPILVVRMKSK